MAIGDIKEIDRITNAEGDERARLLMVQVGTWGLDFHSLSWERLDEGEWKTMRVISQQDFGHDAAHRRWFSDLHSFSDQPGRIIVQVGDDPAEFGTSGYSWREWDLEQNREIRLLQWCKTGADAYRPKWR